MVAPQPSRRTRHKQRTQRALTDAALTLFARNGYDRTTVEEIAGEAGVSPRTFFRYFATKDEVVYADQPALITRIGDALAARPADESLLTGLREGLLELTEDFEERYDLHLTRVRLAMESPAVACRAAGVRRGWETVIADWLRGRLGSAPDDLLPAIIASAAVGILDVVSTAWAVDPDGVDLPAQVVAGLDTMARGFDL